MSSGETIYGGDGNDSLTGTEGDDHIFGGNNGNDTLSGIGGDDHLYGGNGDDSLIGGRGRDVLYGGQNNDKLFGGSGDDRLMGEDGNDSLEGGAGNDELFGGQGNDTLAGNSGDDHLYGGDANDSLYGGAGHDHLEGGQGDDTLYGYSGDDRFYGGEARDYIYGGRGDDEIYGGRGSDQLHGQSGDDLIYGGSGDDSIMGGAGNDSLYGGLGNDSLYGGSGDDIIDTGDEAGNKQTDRAYGGAGNDTIYSGGNQDELYGGSGDDRFIPVADGSNFNNITIYGGNSPHDNDVLDLSQYYAMYPGLQVIYESGSPNSPSGRILLKTASGQELGRINYTGIESTVICFAPGTLIATIRGEVPVEELAAGDRIITRDNGMQELRWIGRRTLTPQELRLMPHMQPVRIRAGALGHGLPHRDLVVSPNHRMLIRSDRAAVLYEESEVLVAAKHLVGMPGVERVTNVDVTYLHLLFDQHEVILANGAWSESFQPGDYSIKGLQQDQRAEVFYLFPELQSASNLEKFSAARRSLKRHEVQVLRAGGNFLNEEDRESAIRPMPQAYRGL